eukprot:symbB.v1.2.025825.t1/scaffold2533.1/size76754/6
MESESLSLRRASFTSLVLFFPQSLCTERGAVIRHSYVGDDLHIGPFMMVDYATFEEASGQDLSEDTDWQDHHTGCGGIVGAGVGFRPPCIVRRLPDLGLREMEPSPSFRFAVIFDGTLQVHRDDAVEDNADTM